jgi:hypothetical protein
MGIAAELDMERFRDSEFWEIPELIEKPNDLSPSPDGRENPFCLVSFSKRDETKRLEGQRELHLLIMDWLFAADTYIGVIWIFAIFTPNIYVTNLIYILYVF